MAVNKSWVAMAWLLAVAALSACATSGNETTGTGGSASASSSTSSASGQGGQGGGAGGGSDTACGDGQLAKVETCDDGNTESGDGCSDACQLEAGWTCAGQPAICSPNCGDGLLVGDEPCDDGNTKKGDGCSPTCGVEDGWSCDAASPTACTSLCGDGFLTGDEQCDDGDMVSNDGCSDACIVEPGYFCLGAPSICSSLCGDGFLAGNEDCDDDNVVPGDGCTDGCQVEEFWTCNGEPSACATPCGDGHVLGPEACDDSNNISGDGCTAACGSELGWTCDGEPSACATTCGDGIIAGAEKCDDTNTKGSDGCSVTCKIEPGWTCSATSPSACATTCGDGFPAGTEACDDGDKVSGDGCSASCQPEIGYVCNNIPSVCVTVCGDGVLGGAEQCDDANTVNNDGCSALCNVQQGWSCSNPAGMPTVCTSICGDNIVVGPEKCDDGNKTDGDCCSSGCQTEAACEIEQNDELEAANDFEALSVSGVMKGSIKPATESDFFSFHVGPDITVALTAKTIDGATSSCLNLTLDSSISVYDSLGTQLGTDDNSGDGNCALLTVGALRGGPGGADYYVEVKSSTGTKTFDYGLELTIKITICGDGVKDPGEQCDDANTADGDGCSELCLFELFSEIEPNNTPANADTNGPYPLSGLWSGAILPAGDTDVYRIDLASTADLTIETFDGTGPSNCVTINPKIELRAANGTTVLASDSDDGVNSCALITAAADVGARHLLPGTYYVVVQPQTTTASLPAYTVQVTPTALCGNGVVEGFEQCDGTPNCDAECDLLPVCGDGVISKGEQCDDGNTQSGDTCNDKCQLELIAETEPNNTFAQADMLPVISGNTLISGAIGATADKDIFKLNVAALSVIRFETFEGLTPNCPAISTAIRLFNSAGVQQLIDLPSGTTASGINNCAALVARLPAGTYYLQVEETGNDGTIPSYLLEIKFEASQGSEVEPNDVLAQGNPLSGVDFFVTGDHQVAADSDFFAITIPAGKSIRAELIEGDAVETCESNGVDSTIVLLNAGGTTLLTDGDDGRGFCSVIDGTGSTPRDAAAHNLAAGTYYLQVKGFSTTGVNSQFNYSLAITIR